MKQNIKLWLEKSITLQEPENKDEELFNVITHALGIVLSLLAAVLLIRQAVLRQDYIQIIGYGVFSLSMLTLYASSTFYHYAPHSNIRRIMRIMDHQSIYLLIAGTYTPIMLSLQDRTAFLVLTAVWILAFSGMILKIVFWGRFGFFHVLFYIGMGWSVVFAWQSLAKNLPPSFLIWAIAGGLTYTLGTIIYGLKKLRFNHGVWHLFVLGGTICFFVAIYLYT